jgi:N-acetyl-1-D-myo-inositol-2-amino-2-deoxy-alpha-D-glucopyranoside deacetylase
MTLFAPGERVVFLHAHPDDETLATGVLIADLVASGHPVAVVTATRGERGEIRPGVDVGEDLIAHREGELAAALAELGVTEHCFLGTPPALAGAGGETGTVPASPGWTEKEPSPLRAAGASPIRFTDSGMRWVTADLAGPADDAGADSLTAAGVDVPAAQLVAFLNAWSADVLVGCDVHGGYGHPDHVACHHIARAAAAASGVRLVEVVSEPLLPADGAVAWSAPERLPAVRRALGCYASQLEVDGDDVVHVGGQRQPIVQVVWLRPVDTD